MNNEKLTISRLDDDDFLVHYACDLRSQMDKMQFVKTDNSGKPETPGEVPTIVRLGRAHAVLDMMISGTYSSRRTVAEAIGSTTATVSRLLNFTFISPEIIERFLAGEIPASKVVAIADKVHMMPFWADQHQLVGIS